MSIEALMAVVPPPAEPSEAFDGPWEPVEAELGRALPQDYKDFVRTYGLGGFSDFLWINVPRAESPYVRLEAEVRAAYGIFHDDEEFDQPLWPTRGGLMTFGKTDFGDYVFWLTRGPPDEWPVVVWGRGTWKLELFECGLTDFLAGVLKNEIIPGGFPEAPYDPIFKRLADFPEPDEDAV